jgi:Fe-S-cluster-containing dehydrogenase component
MNDQQRAAIQHYEAALKAAFPEGATGEVFNHWNEARKALAQPQENTARCGGCSKTAKDGWALYCVECWEKAQPQGEWVDLTDDEVNEIVHEKVMDMRMTYKDLVCAVIAAFKEKNK